MGVDIEEYLDGFSISCDEIINILITHNIKYRYMSSKICLLSTEQEKVFLKRMNLWDIDDKKYKGNIMLKKFNLCINEIIKNQNPDEKYILFLKSMIY